MGDERFINGEGYHYNYMQPQAQRPQSHYRQSAIYDDMETSDEDSYFERNSHFPEQNIQFIDDYEPMDKKEPWDKRNLDEGLRVEKTETEAESDKWGWSHVFLILITFLLASLVLLCNVLSKLGLAAIANSYRLLTPVAGSENKDLNVAFFMLALIVMLPQGIGFLVSIWNNCYKTPKNSPHPSGRAMFFIVIQTLCESMGMCLLLFYVGCRIEPGFLVLLMNGIFSIPSVAKLRWLYRRRTRSRGYQPLSRESSNSGINGAYGSVNAGLKDVTAKSGPSALDQIASWASCLGQLSALAFVPLCLFFISHESVTVSVLAAVAMFLLSAAWLPDLQYKTMDTLANDHNRLSPHLRTRCKTTIYSSALRIAFTTGFLFVYSKFDSNLGEMSTSAVFHAFRHSELFTPFIVQLVATWVGYQAARAACIMSVQVVGFAIPLALSTPVTFLLMVVVDQSMPFNFNLATLGHSNSMIWLTAMGLALWFSAYMLTRRTVWNKKTPSVALDETLFFQPVYNGVLLEQYTILNRRPPDQGPKVLSASDEMKRSKIYICTTMYREDRAEMTNTVSSLLDLDLDDTLRDMCESHVIMDGGAQRDIPGEFAVRLVSVIQEVIEKNTKARRYVNRPIARQEVVEAEGSQESASEDGYVEVKPDADQEKTSEQRWFEHFDLLKSQLSTGCKIHTPYGIRLEFLLPCGMPMILHLKDPDKVKKKKRWSQVLYMYYFLQFRVPAYNRESQKQASYIMTTDADIKFRPRDVKALFAMLSRDSSVGAVCGRTFPIGDGPLCWYQIFDYAVGHWFQKTAEHVLGTVLCCPGCFSMYRFEALRDVLIEYSSEVKKPLEFLTKDMGEDRWLCTLLVLAGWRLDYTAAAYDETHCPTSFNEFFNQRRRWIPSTLANILQLIVKWRTATRNNDSMSFFFIIYQCAMLFSAIVSPATVILVIYGGLSYSTSLSTQLIFGWMLGLTLLFCIVCMTLSQDIQLVLAKILTLIFALVMGAVTIGVASEVGSELSKDIHPDKVTTTMSTTTEPHNKTMLFENPTEMLLSTTNYLLESSTSGTVGGVNLSVSTIYLAAIIGMFLLAGLFHPDEATALFHGIWYLLCLPGGYLFLLIYAFTNLNDRSWGTREEAIKKANKKNSFQEVEMGCGRHVGESVYHFFGRILCCRTSVPPEPEPAPLNPYTLLAHNEISETKAWSLNENGTVATCAPVDTLIAFLESPPSSFDDDRWLTTLQTYTAVATDSCPLLLIDNPADWLRLWNKKERTFDKAVASEEPVRKMAADLRLFMEANYTWPESPGSVRFGDDNLVKFTEAFMKDICSRTGNTREYIYYADRLKEQGFTDTSFLLYLKSSDVKDMNLSRPINGPLVCQLLLKEVEDLSYTSIPDSVPNTIDEWLQLLRLDCYTNNFIHMGYREDDLKTIANLTLADLKQMGIKKVAHVRKLEAGLKKLKQLTNKKASSVDAEYEKQETQARNIVHALDSRDLRESILNKRHNLGNEEQFWEAVVDEKIGAKLENLQNVEEMKRGLYELRNNAVLILFVVNALWVIFMVILATKSSSSLKIIGTNPLGFFFLAVYGGIFFVQFLTLLWHRIATIMQALSHVTFKKKETYRVIEHSSPV